MVMIMMTAVAVWTDSRIRDSIRALPLYCSQLNELLSCDMNAVISHHDGSSPEDPARNVVRLISGTQHCPQRSTAPAQQQVCDMLRISMTSATCFSVTVEAKALPVCHRCEPFGLLCALP